MKEELEGELMTAKELAPHLKCHSNYILEMFKAGAPHVGIRPKLSTRISLMNWWAKNPDFRRNKSGLEIKQI